MRFYFSSIKRIISILFLVFLIFIFIRGNRIFAGESPNSPTVGLFDSNSLLVMMKKGHYYEENRKVFEGSEVENIEDLTKELDRTNEHYQQILQIDLNSNVNTYVERIRNLDSIEHIGSNECVQLATSSNDSDYVSGKQWGLEKINIEGAWNYTTGSKNVRVGVIDSGISSHDNLNDNLIWGKSFCEDNDDPFNDRKGHGTHVAGIIGAKGNNGIAINGVCQDIVLVPLKVFTNTDLLNKGACVQAISYAISSYNTDSPIEIINYSIVHYNEEFPELKSVLKQYPGLFVCAAGNIRIDGITRNIDERHTYPAFYGSDLFEESLDNLIVVGNSDKNDRLAEDSCYGKKSVNLFAPGQNIYSTLPGNKYGYDSGTSMATPFVTGVAALLLSKYPNMTVSELKASILMNVDKVSSLSEYCTTGGRLNAYKALSNPHFHNYQYYSLDLLHHEYRCSCGMNSQEGRHHFKNNVCNECNLCHAHSFSMTYRDNKTHINTCICGATTGQAGGHAVSQSDAYDGDNKATCVGCGALLDLNHDMALILPYSNRGMKRSANGSFILPSGVIVLVDEDMEAYFNGSLLFYDSEFFLN